MAGLGGNWKHGLEQMIKGLNDVAKGVVQKRLNVALGTTAVSLVKQGFRSGTDPSGNPWTPTLRGGRILRLTGRLGNSFFKRSTEDGFRIYSNVIYAGVHQDGMTIHAKTPRFPRKNPTPMLVFQIGDRWVSKASVTIPARRMLPEDELPPKWLEAFDKTFDRVMGDFAGLVGT